jgi:hypothetical protein
LVAGGTIMYDRGEAKRLPDIIWSTHGPRLRALDASLRSPLGFSLFRYSGVLNRLFACVVRAHRARRDVDRGRVLADEGGPSPIRINILSGGFADEIA